MNHIKEKPTTQQIKQIALKISQENNKPIADERLNEIVHRIETNWDQINLSHKFPEDEGRNNV